MGILLLFGGGELFVAGSVALSLLLGVSMATWGMASGGRLTWVAGLALITGTVINLLWEIRSAKEEPSEASDDMDTEGAAPAPVAAAKLAAGLGLLVLEIGRASCRERVFITV